MTNSFSLQIDPLSSENGWMHCWLVVDGHDHYLDATSVFPPFGDVLAFAQAFKQFLKTDYLAFLHSGENQFDLRSLPIERLIS